MAPDDSQELSDSSVILKHSKLSKRSSYVTAESVSAMHFISQIRNWIFNMVKGVMT